MKPRHYKILRDYIIGWLIASLVWQLLRGSQDVNIPYMEDSFSNILFLFIIAWITQGLLYGVLHIFLENLVRRRIPLSKLLAFALILQIISAIGFYVFIFYLFIKVEIFVDVAFKISEFIQLPVIWVSFIYTVLVNFFISLFLNINLMLGEGNLIKFISGKFYTPKEKELIFMFLDLRSSTSIAEKLGHTKYSKLLQDCFYDLAIVHKYKASIYQYVGDEAVLTWSYKEGLKGSKSIKAFYAFKDQIKKRASYYMKAYGMVPEFKAGMNCGIVTVAEVGEYKREIAYHGDTINTASRIQDQCNRLEVDLLISERLLKLLKITPWAISKLEGKVLLKGKHGTVNIYSLKLNKRTI
ncbi:adenylate/guanylate cyclase domain-containing protein [Flavivirga spongiicola]|uniref:Adenylate/guanylate cyclase domain-containing protein n=1 Tax=Flavivirga spongiicola TaxID=421621 RepID=A0ABU7XUU7_9FLAO|nr:adenylate/guanylate cyclase domain-containing protein [Flavivirga sp. MEBiC05379]MDO5979556.1 adenylate/guanylate cyclase domain-containing protein [Flavivirga sp. MEBiC05379]